MHESLGFVETERVVKRDGACPPKGHPPSEILMIFNGNLKLGNDPRIPIP